jgi:hypothetical protein
LVIGLASFMLVGLRHVKAEHWRRYSVLIVATVLVLGQLLALRIYAPLAMHADFRYVYPVLIPAAVFYAKFLEPESGQGLLLRWFGLFIAGAFAIGSMVFFRPSSDRAHQPNTPASVAVQAALADVSEVRETGTAIEGNAIRFGAHQFLDFRLPKPQDISQIDLSLDADDQYRVLVISPTFSWALWFGPSLSATGLVRTIKDSPFPMRNVTSIEVHAHQSDGDYALGHLRAQ